MDNTNHNQEKKQRIQEQHLAHMKKTGYVYKGAAALILLVGIRSVFLASDEGIGYLGLITLGAIAVEFFLLWMYANSVTRVIDDEDEDSSIDTTKLEGVIEDLHVNLVSNIKNLDKSGDIISAIKDINIPGDIAVDVGPLNDELDKLTTELNLVRTDMSEFSDKVDRLGEQIESYIDENLSDRIKNEVISVITKSAKQNIS